MTELAPESPPPVAVLVASFDGYSDLWRPFFSQFRSVWHDCPYPVFLGSCHKTMEIPGVRQILIGDDVDYSSNLLAMLDHINSPWVILWTDDFFLSAPVDTSALQRLIDEIREIPEAVYLDLLHIPTRIAPLFARPTGRRGIAERPKGSPYRVTLGVTLWSTDFLRSFLRRGETAWDIERRGAVRANQTSARFLSLNGRELPPPIRIVNVVERRAITHRGLHLLRAVADLNGFANWKREPRTRYAHLALYGPIRYALVRVAVIVLGTATATRLVSRIVSSGALSIQN